MILLKNAKVFTPESIGINDLLISDDRIVAISPELSIKIPQLEVLDLEGSVIIPGIIDQHVHITGGGGEKGFSSRVPELQLSQCIEAGVTTLVGLLGTDSRTRTISNLVAKAKGLNEEGVTAYCLTGGYEYPSKTLTGSVGDDIAFIQEVLGVKIAISDHRCSHITKQDMVALASEARIAGLISKKPGIVHIHVGSAGGKIGMLFDIVKSTNIPITQFRPTHLSNFLDEAKEFLLMGGYVDCTSGRSPERAAQQIAELSEIAPLGQITLSSDANGSLPVWNEHREIIGISAAKMSTVYETVKYLVQSHGFSLSKALTVCTKNVAESLSLYPKKGCLTVGSYADFAILDDSMHMTGLFSKGIALKYHDEILKKGTFE